MESLLGSTRVSFEVLRTRLLLQVKRRINNGEFTERGLSRILGISQSQTHNVLKGARRLQMPLADRILTKLGISVIDLLNESELDAALRLKMAEWDRQMAAVHEDDSETFDLSSMLTATKKPAGQSGSRMDGDEAKTG